MNRTGNASEASIHLIDSTEVHICKVSRLQTCDSASALSPTEIRFGSHQPVWGNGVGASHFLRGKKVEHSIPSRGTA